MAAIAACSCVNVCYDSHVTDVGYAGLDFGPGNVLLLLHQLL